MKIRLLSRALTLAATGLSVTTLLLMTSAAAIADAPPVSFYKDVLPIFKQNCAGCHNPGKAKGKLDMSSFVTLQKGGKTGVSFIAGDIDKSLLVTMIKGPEPEMPVDADPLKAEQIAIIERWVKEGAKDDTPEGAGILGPNVPANLPVYRSAPPVTDMKFSPDGSLLAVTGYHEVILHKADGSEIVARLVGGSPRLEALAFSDDGKLLGVAGGAPAQWGEIQVWNLESKKQQHSYRVGNDSLYGVSFSPDHSLVAFGSADKSARILKVADGEEVWFFNNHSDWVFGTTFTIDGKRILTGSRDMAMKLSEIETKRFIDDVNNPLDTVNDMARHPTQDLIAYGGKLGTVRIYKISDNQNRTAARNDTNLIRLFERQPSVVLAIAYAPQGDSIAVGGEMSEVRVYATADGKRLATLPGHSGAVYALAYRPDGKAIATAGFDGTVRIFELPSGNLIKSFSAVPVGPVGNK